LATRIAYGTPITPNLLERIARAEGFLWDLGCRQVRVRVHDSTLARIEVDTDSLSLLIERREAVLDLMKSLGFKHAALDLAGFRSGSWD
ncbi:MAG: TIGR00268 family protein, partial [Acidobacteriota bacterium]